MKSTQINPRIDSNTSERISRMVNIKREADIFLTSIGLGDLEYFIAGGSLFSIVMDSTDSCDIDIYFYRKSDAERVHERCTELTQKYIPNIDIHSSERAFTFRRRTDCESLTVSKFYQESTERPTVEMGFNSSSAYKSIQLITYKYGDVDDVLSSFDINCSKTALTSDLSYCICDDFSSTIITSPEGNSWKHGEIFKRYYKYINHKGAKDPGLRTLQTIVEFCLDNPEFDCQRTYNQDLKMKAKDVLNEYLSIYADQNTVDYIFDMILSKFEGQERCSAFAGIFEGFNLASKTCVELNYHRQLYKLNLADSAQSKEQVMRGKAEMPELTVQELEELKHNYPEIFI